MRPQPGAHSGMVKSPEVRHLKGELGHGLVQADRVGQCAVKNVEIEEILSLAQQTRVKFKHRGVDFARLGGAKVDGMGDADGRRIPRVEVHLHVDARKRLRNAPGDFHPHLFGIGKHARLLADEIQRFQPEPLARAARHAGDVGQVVVDNVDVGGVHVDPALVQHDAAGAKLTNGRHIMADIQHRAPVLIGDVAHFS